MKIEEKKDAVILYMEGRLDSENSDRIGKEIEKELKELCFNAAEKTLYIDASKLTYISSAGLRILLGIQNSHKIKLNIINVTDEVMDILTVTGFTSLMNVRKPLKEIDVSGLTPVGRGMTADVFRLDDERVIKIYNDKPINTDAFIEREKQVSKTIFTHGIPTAIPFDVVTSAGRKGVIYETINANMLYAFIVMNPDRWDEMIEKEVSLLKKIHHTEFAQGELPKLKDTILKDTEPAVSEYVSKEAWKRFEESVYRIPDRMTMIHGDYHPGNIMADDKGELILIDVGDATTGHPVLELGGMIQPTTLFDGILTKRQVMEEFFAIKDLTPEVEKKNLDFYAFTEKYWRASLSCYVQSRDEAELSRIEEELKTYAFIIYIFKTSVAPRGDRDQASRMIRLLTDEYLKRADNIDRLSKWWKDW